MFPLIALPGTLMTAASLQPMVAALGRDARCELLGECEGFDDELERLAAMAPQPSIWVGHSLGGIAALHLAARRPECCAAVIVLAGNLRPDGPLGPMRRAQQRDALHRGGMNELLRQVLAPAYGLASDAPLLDALIDQATQVGAARFKRQLHHAATRPGLLDAAPLQVPVLALCGSDDPLCPPACTAEIVERVAGAPARQHTLAGAGHLLPLQHAAWCAQHIRAFLKDRA